jgi:hypothetical protein
MNKTEIYDWIQKEIIGRWPDTELTQAMKDDFYSGLLPVDQEYATQAAKQQRADSQAKHPNTARIVKIARDLHFGAKPKEPVREYQDICISRVYLGGAETGIAKTLNIGYTSNAWYKVAATIDMNNTERQLKLLDIERRSTEEHYGKDTKWEFFYEDQKTAQQRSYELKGVIFSKQAS